MAAAATRVVEARAPLRRALLHAVSFTLALVLVNAVVAYLVDHYPAWAWVLTSVALPVVSTVVETVRSSQPVTSDRVQSVPAENRTAAHTVVVDPVSGVVARAVPLMAALAAVVLVVGVGALLLVVAARGLVGLVDPGATSAGDLPAGGATTGAVGGDTAPGIERLRSKVSGEFDGVTVRVSSVEQTQTGTRVHVIVENRTSNSVGLPLGPACTLSDSHDSTIGSDPAASRWSQEFPAGLTRSGDIWFADHVGRRRQTASLEFATVLRAAGDGPTSITLHGLRLRLADPQG